MRRDRKMLVKLMRMMNTQCNAPSANGTSGVERTSNIASPYRA
jgi:hypothetical protein